MSLEIRCIEAEEYCPRLYECKEKDYCQSQFNYGDLSFCSAALPENEYKRQYDRGLKAVEELFSINEDGKY